MDTHSLWTAIILLALVVVFLLLVLGAFVLDRSGERDGAGQITKERERQIAEEGYADHDDQRYVLDELALAAVCYAMPPRYRELTGVVGNRPGVILWPWHSKHWKPTDRKRDLVKAGALIAAEIDRMELAEARAMAKTALYADEHASL